MLRLDGLTFKSRAANRRALLRFFALLLVETDCCRFGTQEVYPGLRPESCQSLQASPGHRAAMAACAGNGGGAAFVVGHVRFRMAFLIPFLSFLRTCGLVMCLVDEARVLLVQQQLLVSSLPRLIFCVAGFFCRRGRQTDAARGRHRSAVCRWDRGSPKACIGTLSLIATSVG